MEARAAPARSRYDLALADYPQWHGEPARSLVICTQQRAGSTLLGEAIYFAGGLGCPLEYLHAGFRRGFEARWNHVGLRNYIAALHRLRTDSSGTFSIKLFWRDLLRTVRELDPTEFGPPLAPGIENEIQDISAETHRRIFSTVFEFFPHPVIILLTRRDSVRQAISLLIATQTGAWRKLKHGSAPPALYGFDRVAKFLAIIQKWNADWRAFLRENRLQYYEIVYEDLLEDYEATLRKFFAAIGRPDAAIPPPRLKKQADARSEELLRRFVADFRERASG